VAGADVNVLRLPSGVRDVALIAIAVAGAIGLAALGIPSAWIATLYLIFLWIALSTSWAIFSGNTGYFSFGHGAFFGIGTYATANLVQAQPVWLSVLSGGLTAGVFAAGFGAVVFRVRRLRGETFALITLALTFVVGSVVLNTALDGGAGVAVDEARLPRTWGSTANTLYLAQAAVAALSILIANLVQGSRAGLALFAISDTEAVAETAGVPTYGYKVVVFALSGSLAGLAGAVNALFVGYVTVGETFSITVPLYVLLMGVLGGPRHWLGPAVGAVLIAGVNTIFVSGSSALAARAGIGLALIGAVLFLPHGIVRRPERSRGGPVRECRRHELILPAGSTPFRPQESGEVILSCRDVALSFNGVRALDGVSLDVHAGEILGLVGPNGSGKSTLINAISGVYRPQSGRIQFAGHDLARCTGHRIARLGIARTFQIPQPLARLPAIDTVRLAALFGRGHLGMRAGREEAQRCLRLVGLDSRAASFPAELNLHQRKFLELARALAAGARVILLDEVLAGMIPAEIDGAMALIRNIRDGGVTIVFVEHNIRAVLALTDRLAVLAEGKVIALGRPHDVMGDPEVAASYLGAAHA